MIRILTIILLTIILITINLSHKLILAEVAAEQAATFKSFKYVGWHIFIPAAVDTFGSIDAKRTEFVLELDRLWSAALDTSYFGTIISFSLSSAR